MVDIMASKLASGRSVENDSGALASMIANPTSGPFFLTNYGYSFTLKLIESMLRLVRAGHMIDPRDEHSAQMGGEVFGTSLFYVHPIIYRGERALSIMSRCSLHA